MRRREFLWLGLLVSFGLSCATPSAPAVATPSKTLAHAAPDPPPPPRPRPRERPGLRFHIHPSDAAVLVDERPRGPAREIGQGTGVLALEPGIHRISLERPGYQTWRGEVTVGERVELLEVSLEKKR